MIVESLGVSLAISSFLLITKRPNKTDKIMRQIFENVDYKVKDHVPSLYKKITEDDYTEFIYNVPYGLVDDESLEPIISKTLNKPTKVFFDGKLHVRLFNERLRKSYDYKDFPIVDGWTIPIGKTQEAYIYHDFDLIPHMTVAGATRWGKTVFMKVLMTYLIENHPDDVEFYILDLKGGLAFHRYQNLKQVKCVAGDYKESAEALSQVKKDIQETMKDFKPMYYENIVDTHFKKRKFIIIDEAGELVPTKRMNDTDKKYLSQCQDVLSYIARVSGGLGYRMIFATQYPTADIMDRQIKANSSAKISFRLETGVQSKVAIDETGAEELEYPGRAIYRTVERFLVQTPYLSNNEMWKRLRRFENDSTGKEKEARRTNTFHFSKANVRN